MMKNVILFCIVVGCIFLGKITDAEEPQAVKFHRAAVEQQNISRPDLALPFAEKAYNLEPNNRDFRYTYYRNLCDTATYILAPEKFPSNSESFSVSEKSARESLALINRFLTLLHNVQPKNLQEYSDNCSGGVLSTNLRRFFEMTNRFAQPPYPDWSAELTAAKNQAFQYQFEKGHQAFRERVKNQKSFEEWVTVINLPFFITEFQPDVVKLEFYSEILGDFLRFRKRYKIEHLQTPNHWVSVYYEYLNVFRNFAVYALSRDDDSLKNNEKLHQTLELLRNEKEFQIFVWFIKETAKYVQESGVKNFGSLTSYFILPFGEQGESSLPIIELQIIEAKKKFVQTIRLKIESLPKEMPLTEYEFLYSALNWLALDAGRKFSFYSYNYYQPLLEVAELALKRGDVPIAALNEFQLRIQANKPDQKTIDAVSAVFDQSLHLLREQSKPGGRYEYKSGDQLNRLEYVEKLRNDFKIEVKPFQLVSPWKSIDILLGNVRERGGSDYALPTIRGNNLYVFVQQAQTKSIRLDTVNLKTRKIKKSPSLPLPGVIDMYPFRRRGELCGFVDNVNAYYGSKGYGLYVFPLNGAPPWRLTKEDGLPSDFVHGVGSISGKLYLGIGEMQKESWFVSVELATKKIVILTKGCDKKSALRLSRIHRNLYRQNPRFPKFSYNTMNTEKKIEILASSTAKEGKVPFFNTSPALTFDPFIEDKKRNRLLFWVDGGLNNESKKVGLWAVDGKTGKISQLGCYESYGYWFKFMDDDDHLMVYDSGKTIMIDLEDNSAKLLCGGYLGRPGRKEEKPLWGSLHFEMATVMNGYLWGKISYIDNITAIRRERVADHWGRVSLADLAQTEILTRPPNQEHKQHWLVYEVLPLPDRSGLIVCDFSNVYLMKCQ